MNANSKQPACIIQEGTWNDFREDVKKVDEGFNYSSGNNTSWESVDSLRKLINKHVDIDFKL